VLLQDIRYALRTLWRSKGFATVAILCLGLGIGLNTTIFSIVDGVLLKPFPYHDPERLVVLGTRNLKRDEEASVSYADLRDWKEANSSFTTIAGVGYASLTISDGAGEPERYFGARISWDLFPMLGVAPILGRGFTASEDVSNGGGVVILGHDVWTSRYQADPNVLGRSILVNTKPHVVIGVMPPRFAFPENQQVWVPLAPESATQPRDARFVFSLGRLKTGVSIERSVEDLNGIAARLAQAHPATNTDWAADVRTMRSVFIPDDVSLVLKLMMAGVTLVLFIACSNVANLLLARAAARRREFALRVAIGAGRARIVRQLLTDGVVLALASVPLGLVLAVVGTRLIAGQMPADQVPYYVQWEVDARSLGYTIFVAISTALLFGLVPALQVTQGTLHESLKEGSRGNSGGRAFLRNTLVVSQVSLALVALVGALLFVRTFVNLETFNLGFESRPLMTLRYFMTGPAYDEKGAKARRVEDVMRRVEALPGVEAAFASNLIPLSGGGGGGEVEVEGRANETGRRPRITFAGVTPHFHKTLGVHIVRGRDFTDAEGWSRAPVAVINETMATRLWPDADPIDRRFRLWNASGSNEWLQVIGVAADMQLFGVDPSNSQPTASAFAPYGFQELASVGLTIRVAGDPAGITASVREAIRAADRNLPIFQVRTMEEVRRVSFWQYGLFGWIFGAIGVVGLMLASVGVYGVLAYAVSQRTQELGVRVALGADRARVIRLVTGEGLVLAGIGVGIGVVLAALGTPLAKSLLYNVSPFDPFTFIVVSVFLVLVALAASYVPARRASRIDPIVALRAE
jgi:putative ABC transport system permease protein